MNNSLSLRSLRISLISVLFALLAWGLLTVGVSAYSTPTSAAASIPLAGAPSTSIVYSNKHLAFNPTSVQIFLAHGNAISVFNTTNRTQILVDTSGKVVMTLAPASNQTLSYSVTGTYVYHLKGHAKVTFTAIIS